MDSYGFPHVRPLFGENQDLAGLSAGGRGKLEHPAGGGADRCSPDNDEGEMTMSSFNIALAEEGLTAYAIERQNGIERHQRQDEPPWSETRRFWIDAILQGMARLDGVRPDPKQMERFDQRLAQARGSFAAEPATVQSQKETIRELQCYLSAVEAAGDDRRRQIAVVRDLLEDMASHLPGAGLSKGLHDSLEQSASMLGLMTARRPIRFTRILLGWETGPCESAYVSGAVTTPEEVTDTLLFRKLSERYPEVTDWPALCVVYNGAGLDNPMGVVDASEFDLAIMNEAGDCFLNLPGIRWAGGPYEMRVADSPAMTMTMQ